MAGIVAGVGMVAAMSFAGATPETSSTVDSLIGGLPPFLAQLNLGIVALVVNLIVMVERERRDARRTLHPRVRPLPARRAGRVERFAGRRRRGRSSPTWPGASTGPAGPTRRRTRSPSTGSRARGRARTGRVLARRLRLARGRGDAERLRAVRRRRRALPRGRRRPAAAAPARLAEQRVGVPQHPAAAARAHAGDRPLAAGLRLLVHAGRGALRDRGVRGRAPWADALARPRALPGRRRRLGREHRGPARARVSRRRGRAAPLHDAAAPARDLAGVGGVVARGARALAPGGGRLRAHPGHAAADARVRAARLAGRPDELDRREVRPLDRRARRRRPTTC